MLEPTSVGVFGRTRAHLHIPDNSGTFDRIVSQFDVLDEVKDFSAIAGSEYGEPAVAMVVSCVDRAIPGTTHRGTERSLWLEFFIGDRSDKISPRRLFPPKGRWGGEFQEVDFSTLFEIATQVMGGRQQLHFQSRIAINASDAQLEFPLPLRLWRSKPPLGSMIGARFELDVRGAKDGWLTLDSRDAEVIASMGFLRNVELDQEAISRIWSHVKRIYDRVLVLNPRVVGELL